MGKADKLQMGAKKTGRGLFADMQSLKGREEAATADNKVTSDTVKTEKATKSVKKSEPVIEAPAKNEDILSTIMEPAPESVPIEPKAEIESKPIESPSEIIEEVQTEINKMENKPKREADKSTSRYEKDKFLLLDIRGYRDYVEHMSKAANMSATKYIRGLIEKDMEKNRDIYDAHKKLEQMLMNRTAGQQ